MKTSSKIKAGGLVAAYLIWAWKRIKSTQRTSGIGNVNKAAQLNIILRNNPANDNFSNHTWVRTVDDILTYPEALEYDGDWSDGYTPDFTATDIKRALKSGEIIVYSSYPIKAGIFVTPSKMEAQSYAGSKDVYSKLVKLSDVAWLDGLQGQYAPIGKVEHSDFYEATIISEDGKFKVVFSVIYGSGTIRAEIYQRTEMYIDPNNYDPNTMVEWFKWKTIYDGSLKGAFRKARNFIVNSGSYINPEDFENL